MNRLIAPALFSLVVALGGKACAQHEQQGNRLTLKSKVLGEERIVLVRTPAAYDAGEERFPVLYMTDGADQLGHTASTIEFLARKGRMPEMIVVAITNTDRGRDLTPTKLKDEGGKERASSGGADKFLTFIETELIPQIEKTYRTRPYRAFAGHSLGGLFAMHAFATRNDLFNAYIAVSPSLWWDNEFVIRETAEFLKGRKDLTERLFITLGNEQGNMRSGFDKLEELLGRQHLKGFAWHAMRMEDEDHGTVTLRSHYFGLRWIFDGWQCTDQIMDGGVQAVEDHYKKLSAKYKYTILPSESVINLLAYRLLWRGCKDEAIALFEANVKRFPKSANVYDSLAEAYEKAGKLDLAKSNYERAIRLAEKSHDDAGLRVYRINCERVSKELIRGDKKPRK
jgi:predicted alpha/beta superfamily hydrolase